MFSQSCEPHGRNIQRYAPLPLYIALFFLLVCINALVAKFVVFTFTIAPGVSLFYIVVASMIIFTLWFGLWGAGAAYIGCFIGAGLLSGIPWDISLYWSIADLIQVLIPLLAFRYARADIGLADIRDLGILIVSGVIINNLAGAAWGTLTLAWSGMIPPDEIISTFTGWWMGNIIVCMILLPPILRIITPMIRNHELFVTGLWR